VGPYGPGSAIPTTWARLQRWAFARDLWTPDRVCLGIAHDDPNITAPEKCRYDACIVIPESFAVEDAINVATLPGGKVASSAFHGSAQEVSRAWHLLFHWLPGSGFQPDDRPCVEIYRGEAWNLESGVVACELVLPVRPL
jgi:AraC family transcriptional regulator